ncbi:MAG: 50S ribosomal protein L6 [Candidatus Nanoarchaeia archaeon]|jgi:large subunit ribosomal protein L6
MKTIVELPESLSPRMEGSNIIVKGPKGEVSKELKNPFIKVVIEGNNVIIESLKDNRRGKALMNTFKAHVNNLITGVTKGYEARLRICYAHFPINVKVEGDKFMIENFSGEKIPRKARIMPECKVEIKGSDVIITGLNKELVGQTAANIEIATKIKNKDLRIFQDGIWIIKKPGKELL